MSLYTYKNLGRVGRLGNQLWQIFGTIGIADIYGGEAYIRPSWDYKKYFSVPDRFYTRASTKDVVDGGTEYYQDLKLWDNIKDDVAEWAQPSELSRTIMNERFKDLQTARPTCSIHVRRGDYLQHPELFPFTGIDYYEQAIDIVCESGVDPIFFVFSDDIPWCKENFKDIDRDFFFIEGVARPVEVRDRKGEPQDQFDMFLMADCDYHIISNSTFSWWGAWISGDSKVLYPLRWYGPGLSDVDWTMMIPDTWIKVEV